MKTYNLVSQNYKHTSAPLNISNLQNRQQQSHTFVNQNHNKTHTLEPRHIMPEYDGTVEWKAFWLQFQTIAEYYEWGGRGTVEKIDV